MCFLALLAQAALFERTRCTTLILIDERAKIVDVVVHPTSNGQKTFAMRDEARRALEAATAKAAASGGNAGARPWSPPEVMYLMYTSGSTGKPKGCIVPTSGVWHRFGWGTSLLGFTQEDVFVLKTPATFDCSIPEMWVPIYTGATSVVIPDGAHLDFEVVKRTMERARVTVAHFVPSVLTLFLDFVSPGELPALRQISCTGEALLLSHREKLTANLGRPLPLFNLYGPTEAAIEVTYFDARDDTPGAAHGFPIGFAGDSGVQVYVTDLSDPASLKADGDKGEICLGGIQVAYGYLNRPELTASKFVPNPHGAGLLYRTGDLGTRDAATGELRYNGRADRQVKVGGVRIELGEIEAVTLKRFPSLLNVAVEKLEDRLVGVAAPRPGQEAPSTLEVQAALAGALPAAYVPAEWHFRDALPLGSAGKVDHKQVLAWVEDQAKASMWGAIYDELYFANEFQVSDGVDDPTMDWAAYTDSFTNEMHERPTIVEWVDETVREIVSRAPKSVVEMGCGKGMILYRVAGAPCVAEYVGCDLSRLAVRYVERVWSAHVARPPEACAAGEEPIACDLSTFVRDASNFGGLRDEGYDAVVCNGVSMYFPSASYLVDVLQAGLPKIAPGGAYHFGDVISKDHYDLFLLRRARHFEGTFESLQDDATRQKLFAAAKDRCFDHRLFFALHAGGTLPGVAAVEVQLKHGEIMSEFTRYRYNVILHKAPKGATAQKALDVVTVDAADVAARASAESVASALKALAASSPFAAVACHGVPNARLTADAQLYAGEADAAAPAVQIGVGDGGGVDPAALRVALAAALPSYHVVLQWARDGKEHHMDAYAFPVGGEAYPVEAGASAVARVGTLALAPGLLAVMRSATELAGAQALAEQAGKDVEAFTNQLQTVDTGASKGGGASDEAAKAEARKLWHEHPSDAKARATAVLTLVGAQIGAGGPVAASASFSEMGGNSFVAMQTIGAVRATFGVSVPVFELLTKTFGAFAEGVVKKGAAGDAGEGGGAGWVSAIDGSTKWGRQASIFAPTFVFFPQAGSSPKHYAGVYKALAKRCPLARYLFLQPPGRDARADEPNETDYTKVLAEMTAALTPFLVGADSKDGPTIFVGDSWGAIAAFGVAHALREQSGWTPTHIAVSGNASPAVTSTHMGLGTYSAKPMADLTDADLVAFLRASGVSEEEMEASSENGEQAALLAAFRADCQLYEDYKRPAQLPTLRSKLMVLLGKADKVTCTADAYGWLDEVDAEESRVVRVAGATHHVHEEQPDAVADHLMRLMGITPPKQVVLAGGAKEVTVTLPPPEDFVRGVDTEALQSFREGNLLYRMGSHNGSKGELSSLTSLSRNRSEEWPSRTESPM